VTIVQPVTVAAGTELNIPGPCVVIVIPNADGVAAVTQIPPVVVTPPPVAQPQAAAPAAAPAVFKLPPASQ
jgi:hypothetical protein